MGDFTWTGDQARALTAVATWYRERPRQVYRLDGYAGTGKTTLARHLAADINGPVHFMAFTGKAALALRKAGIANAGTIHSLLYEIGPHDLARVHAMERELAELREQGAHPDTIAECEAEIRFERAKLDRPRFVVREECVLSDAKLLVVDEWSMVDATIGRDLEALRVPILLLGDPMQLPPIEGPGYFARFPTDTLLTEITRQAADSPIIRYATAIRNGESLPFGVHGTASDSAAKVPRAQVTDEILATKGGQLLCGKNAVRRELNARVRTQRGFTSPTPVVGDRVVCLRNSKEAGLLNGEIATVTKAEGCDLSITTELGKSAAIRAHPAPFDGRPLDQMPPQWEHNRRFYPIDYGYALTVHKAQGSQWDRVTVVDDGMFKRDPEARKRWLYTAATRAAKKLVIVA